jgi:hypothetical protein
MNFNYKFCEFLLGGDFIKQVSVVVATEMPIQITMSNHGYAASYHYREFLFASFLSLSWKMPCEYLQIKRDDLLSNVYLLTTYYYFPISFYVTVQNEFCLNLSVFSNTYHHNHSPKSFNDK